MVDERKNTSEDKEELSLRLANDWLGGLGNSPGWHEPIELGRDRKYSLKGGIFDRIGDRLKVKDIRIYYECCY